MPKSALRILILVLAIAFALSPVVSNGFAGFRPSQFPVIVDRWPAQPAGWAFSIWLLIYAALIVAAATGVFGRSKIAQWDQACVPLAISLAVGVFWVEAATRSPLLATAMIVIMAVTAVLARLRAGGALWQRVPLGLYAGWLTAATGVACSAVLTGYGVLDAQIAALLMLALVLIAALWVQSRLPDAWAYGAAVIWALWGVVFNNLDPLNLPVLATAVVGIVLLGGMLVRRGLAVRRTRG